MPDNIPNHEQPGRYSSEWFALKVNTLIGFLMLVAAFALAHQQELLRQFPPESRAALSWLPAIFAVSGVILKLGSFLGYNRGRVAVKVAAHAADAAAQAPGAGDADYLARLEALLNPAQENQKEPPVPPEPGSLDRSEHGRSLWWLPGAVLALALLLCAGCVSTEARVAAAKLDKDIPIMRAESLPHLTYSPEQVLAYQRDWDALQRTAHALNVTLNGPTAEPPPTEVPSSMVPR